MPRKSKPKGKTPRLGQTVTFEQFRALTGLDVAHKRPSLAPRLAKKKGKR